MPRAGGECYGRLTNGLAPRCAKGKAPAVVPRVSTLGVRHVLACLDDGGLVGKASCNRFRTSFKLTGESLSIAPAAATMMACEPRVMQQEQALLRQLESVAGFDIRADGALVLKGKDGEALVARRR